MRPTCRPCWLAKGLLTLLPLGHVLWCFVRAPESPPWPLLSFAVWQRINKTILSLCTCPAVAQLGRTLHAGTTTSLGALCHLLRRGMSAAEVLKSLPARACTHFLCVLFHRRQATGVSAAEVLKSLPAKACKVFAIIVEHQQDKKGPGGVRLVFQLQNIQHGFLLWCA